jgi:hypothetical protein
MVSCSSHISLNPFRYEIRLNNMSGFRGVTVECVWIGWLDLLHFIHSWLLTKSNYSATANLHTSPSTRVPAKPFPASCVLTSRFLATASNSGDSSASHAQVLPSLNLIQNCLPTIPSTEMNRHLFSASLAELRCTLHLALFSTPALPTLNSVYNRFARTEHETSIPTIISFFLASSLPRKHVYWAGA